ncbi:hypothetical protein [Mesorhizobium sp.]|uniref:hypothetical protein n=1 Tax=Mesorhizobium sp. TaxID=1871066 RepID=UPI0025FB02DE|nr:hypothetical protein [Mesorhizobium sp.]
MRKRIRLTGRRQLPRSSVEAKVVEIGSKRLVTLTFAQPELFRRLPRTARIKLKLFENKFSETLEFGTLETPKATCDLKNGAFSAPSCQLRIVESEPERRGLLLASTDTWTLRANADDGDTSSEGILKFQPFDIAPRSWKLSIRDDDYPVVYVDRRIPENRTWVRNDPVFISCVLPVIVREIFEDILSTDTPPERGWMRDWVDWADKLMPGSIPPYSDSRLRKLGWIDDLLDAFCKHHGTLDMLIGRLNERIAS